MPFVSIQTNVDIKDAEGILLALSKSLAEGTGKPERAIMTAFNTLPAMTFAGSPDAAVFMECKSIGLTAEQASELAARLCSFCEEHLGVAKDRVYIEFVSPERPFWGWNGDTL